MSEERAVSGLLAGRAAIRLVYLVCLVLLALNSGPWTRAICAGVAVAVLIDLVRLLRQGQQDPGARADWSRPAPAKFNQPGEHRVVLQVRGPNPVLVMRELRRTTGKHLVEVKKIVDDTPAIVVEDLSEASAQAVVDRLTRAGARAIAAPMEARQ